MPTPVITAKQCLTAEASQALDEAVAVARRRAHSQTTSLHAVSALLSVPSSALREACGRARNGSYSARIQFKALELCLGVSLDRIPTSAHRIDEPPVSNSLMAAVKRSQANQRRQPDNFHFYQQQQQSSSSSITTVKVELRNLILSILDDPVVSRVFGEAGFRNCDIKYSLLRPVHQIIRYSRYKGPPMFLCNLNDDSNLDRPGFNFPYAGDENCKRIGEILVRKKGSNPILVGVSALDTLTNFCDIIRKTKGVCPFPVELSALSLISIENEVVKFVTGNYGEGLLKLKFEEINGVLGHSIGGGLLVNIGDLQGLVGDNASIDAMSHVIRELANFLKLYSEKVWLIGATTTYETFMKIFNRFPSIEQDWNLQLLPVTSTKTHPMAETYPRSSLMESFVPFGGFFSVPSDAKKSINNSYEIVSRCQICNSKCEQEITNFSTGGCCVSVADQYQSTLPSWLKMAEVRPNREFDVTQTKEKVARLQIKWDAICQHLHHPQPDSYLLGSKIPSVLGFHVSQIETGGKEIKDVSQNSKIEDDGLTKSASLNSVTTDLGLGIHSDFHGPLDQKDFKLLYTSLFKTIGRQEEALSAICETIVQKRTDKQQASIWFSFVGPDIVAKNKIAVFLAEILFGNNENIIRVNLGSKDGLAQLSSSLSLQQMKDYEMKFRGKTVVDFIAAELSRKPFSVVFLENIEKADLQLQKALFKAVKSGRFSDSHGREIGISNTVFVTSSKSTNISKIEEILSKGKGQNIRMLIRFDLGDAVAGQNMKVLDITRNKRKLIGNYNDMFDRGRTSEIAKRVHVDLNLPAEESDDTITKSNTWLEDLFEEMDKTVVFEAVDYSERAEEMEGEISRMFRKVVGPEGLLELDSDVMNQVVAASIIMEENKVREWVQSVLSNAFSQAKKKYSLSSGSVVQLVNNNDDDDDEEELDGILPNKIIMK
jgi:hypothetical protein